MLKLLVKRGSREGNWCGQTMCKRCLGMAQPADGSLKGIIWIHVQESENKQCLRGSPMANIGDLPELGGLWLWLFLFFVLVECLYSSGGSEDKLCWTRCWCGAVCGCLLTESRGFVSGEAPVLGPAPCLYSVCWQGELLILVTLVTASGPEPASR